MTKSFDEASVRTRAYLLWEADGRPFGRDEHYWGIALAEATPPAKPKRAAANASVAQKKVKPAAKATRPAAAKAVKTKARAPVAKGKKK